VGYFDAIVDRVSIAHLTKDKLSNILFPNPPLLEQTAIVAHIETQSAKIDQAIDLQQQQIDKLNEYKATLINAAVTGKIKVTKGNHER
jgi:type I restriction enzyme S subunit